MNFRPKYTYPVKNTGRGPKIKQEYPYGNRPIDKDRYYGWLKHKAQANYRGEEHNLAWEEWRDIWTDERWLNRGRHVDQYMLVRRDNTQGWSLENVILVLAQNKGEYYAR